MFLAGNGVAQSMLERGVVRDREPFWQDPGCVGLWLALGFNAEMVRIDEQFESRAGPGDGTFGFAWSLNGPSAMLADRTPLRG